MKHLIGLLAATLLIFGCERTQEDMLVPGMPVDTEEVFAATLPWNSDAEGVRRTSSGLEFRRIRQGQGDTLKVTINDLVTVDYEGRLTTGEIFDSSYARGEPFSFRLDQVISGWTEGLQHMRAGDVFVFYIPSELAYGERPPPGALVKPNDDLIFLVELHSFEPLPPPPTADEEAWNEYHPWDSKLSIVNKTGSGLEYIILESGDESGISPTGNEMVTVHYEGRFAESGDVFDSSFKRRDTLYIPLDVVIEGWGEVLQLMKPGDRWLAYIPSEIGYGEVGTPNGHIPPDADLMFEIALLDVTPGNPSVADMHLPDYLPWESDSEDVVKTGSGLEYIILNSGYPDGPSPVSNETVVFYSIGRFAETGEVFENDYEDGIPSSLPVNVLIPGLVEVLKLMKTGDSWVVYIPSELAFGQEGDGYTIPPNADLVYEIQLVNVFPPGTFRE